MQSIYKKATSEDDIIRHIRNMNVQKIKQNGATLFIPVVSKDIRKLIKRELKRLKIYNKVKIVVTNDVKKAYINTLH